MYYTMKSYVAAMEWLIFVYHKDKSRFSIDIIQCRFVFANENCHKEIIYGNGINMDVQEE